MRLRLKLTETKETHTALGGTTYTLTFFAHQCPENKAWASLWANATLVVVVSNPEAAAGWELGKVYDFDAKV